MNPDVAELQQANARGECSERRHVLGVAYGGANPWAPRFGVCGRCGEKVDGKEAEAMIVRAYVAQFWGTP